MDKSSVYILIVIATLAVIAVLLFLVKPKGRPNKLSPLAALSFAFAIAGIVFGEGRFIGYSLLGIGIILAIVDIIIKFRKEPE